ncbi:hypothetical protein [Nocardioides alkalitolerans]|uniref:hypothetical protein n=1 Tax=Nocardioides alkalitolerans TaxID=281714 RepID=UPI0012FCD810|nr:hypothetical protein [Nocardioides alkalitolerans]
MDAETTNQVSTTALVLIGAAGGVGALIAGFVTAYVNHLNERRVERRAKTDWYRSRKYEAFSSLAEAANLSGALRLSKKRVIETKQTWSRQDELDAAVLVIQGNQIKALMLLHQSKHDEFRELLTKLQEGEFTGDSFANTRHAFVAFLQKDLLDTGARESRKQRRSARKATTPQLL